MGFFDKIFGSDQGHPVEPGSQDDETVRPVEPVSAEQRLDADGADDQSEIVQPAQAGLTETGQGAPAGESSQGSNRSGKYAFADQLTFKRMHQALERAGVKYAVFPDNDVVLLFPEGHIRVSIVNPENAPVLLGIGQWEVEIPIHARVLALETCADMNNNRLLPCCYVTTGDEGITSFCADVAVPFEKGCTDRQLDVAIGAVLGAINSAFAQIREKFPDTRFGPDPLKAQG